jgi:hypothetical protein
MIDDGFEVCFELRLFALSHACKTPPEEGAGAVPCQSHIPGARNKKKKKPYENNLKQYI